MTLSNKERAAKRAEAQTLDIHVQVGKSGLSEEVITELRRHLKQHKLVKVRLLPAATEGGTDEALATALAEATGSELVERRGHTAVLWRP